jgi:deazaflavin-dependent oxidoreductase (nitroreductase family)
MTTTAQQPTRPRRANPLLGATHLFNKLVLLLAGTRFLPLYGVLVHRGRRSGKTFRTPVVVRAASDGFIVPMPWGESTDWCRNVRAAGECVVRWKGRDYAVWQPEIVDADDVTDAFNAFSRAMMRRLQIRQCLRLRHRPVAA